MTVPSQEINVRFNSGDEKKLTEILIKLNLVTLEQINTIKEQVKSDQGISFEKLLVDCELITKQKLTVVIAKYINLPKAQKMLQERIELRKEKEKGIISKGVEENISPFVMDDSQVKRDLFFKDGGVMILGPELNIDSFEDCKMDELQVAQMTMMLLSDEQWEETEAYLIEASQDFPGSIILRYQLIWLYNATGFHNKAIEHSRLIENNTNLEPVVYELLAWTMLKNRKYLEAIRLYQILCKTHAPIPIWYYLLAFCLDKEKLYKQSNKIFTFYLNFKDEPADLVSNAKHYIEQNKERG